MTYFSGYPSGEIKQAITGNSSIKSPDNDSLVKHLLIDSRMLVDPASSIFFAIRTSANDGHNYIHELYSKGVRLFVISKHEEEFSKRYPEADFIFTENTLAALQKLTAYHRKKHRYPLLAITGSNGKTIVKEWLFQLLNEDFKVVRNPKSYNSQIGVPLSVWQLDNDYELGIFEAGISMPGEMSKLYNILHPDFGIFTNIGPAHDEGFTNRRQKIKEKLKLFENVQKLIYCADYKDLHKEILNWQKNNKNVELCPWSKQNNVASYIKSIEKSESGVAVDFIYNQQNIKFSLPYNDSISIENAIHCLTFICATDLLNDSILRRFSSLQPVAMRMELKQGINQCSIINDSYNSDLHSLSIALDFLSGQLQHNKKRLILSDILQSGIPEEKLYEQVASLVKSKQTDYLIGIGTAISRQASKFDIPSEFYPDTATFINTFNFSKLNNEAILLKGARLFGFEKIVKHIQQQDHQTVLEINLDALVHNLKVYKSLIAPKTKVMAMVKAFSYGSGSYEIASILSRQNCNYLAVAYADEGKELRINGIIMPIVVMNPELESLNILNQYNLEPEVYSLELFEKIAISARDFKGISADNPFPVHIKIDTGMHRLGFMQYQIKQLISQINRNPHIKIASVFSHLAASDQQQHDDFTKQQINSFIKTTTEIEESIGYPFIRHICNSTAISRFPEAHFDMVRLGIGLYGIDSNPNIQPLLKNVSSFKSVISQIKSIKKGESIGYSRSAVADKELTIAVVPIGYADGLNRRLSNGNGVLYINNRPAPIIGNISMDMCTLDITGIEAKVGDEVIVFNENFPLLRLAESLDTIPYEILTSVSHRVKRVYFRE